MTSIPGTYYSASVLPDWVDANGHMNVLFYASLFENALNSFIRELGFDSAYRDKGFSLFTAESHIYYVAEAKLNEQLKVATRIIEHDAKRFHIYQEMHVKGANERLVATDEHMMLHVQLEGPKVSPMREDCLSRLRATQATQKSVFPNPSHVGRTIGLRPKA